MSLTPSDVTLAIDPFSWHFERDRLFEPDSAQGLGADDMAGPFIHLHRWFGERGVRVHTADRLLRGEVGSKRNIVMSFGLRSRYHALGRRNDVTLSAFFGFESPVVDPKMYRAFPDIAHHFKRLYSFSDTDAVAPVVGSRVPMRRFEIPYPLERIREDLFARSGRKFLILINHNKSPALAWNELCTERMRAVEYFGRTNDIDLYGKGWDGPSFLMGMPQWVPGTAQHAHYWLRKQWQRVSPDPLLVAARKVYRGFSTNKLETLSAYDFCLCFENAVLNGWVTEKLFDCFVVGTVPIFLGAPDVQKFVPPECFIDMRNFASYEELRAFLKQVSPREIAQFKQAMRDFIGSAAFRRFSSRLFTELLGRIVSEDTGVEFSGLPPAPV
jgi:alpha(1,3/1,4) fucosyltransferase